MATCVACRSPFGPIIWKNIYMTTGVKTIPLYWQELLYDFIRKQMKGLNLFFSFQYILPSPWHRPRRWGGWQLSHKVLQTRPQNYGPASAWEPWGQWWDGSVGMVLGDASWQGCRVGGLGMRAFQTFRGSDVIIVELYKVYICWQYLGSFCVLRLISKYNVHRSDQMFSFITVFMNLSISLCYFGRWCFCSYYIVILDLLPASQFSQICFISRFDKVRLIEKNSEHMTLWLLERWIKERREKERWHNSHSNGPHARSSSSMGDAEGFMQVEMGHIRANVPRSTQTHLGIHVCSIQVNL